MNPIALAEEVEARYRRYLQTTFYFKDPALRESFEKALKSGRLSKGPYVEATPVFKRGASPRSLFSNLLPLQIEEGFLNALQSERPLYQHQEASVRSVFQDRNIVVATGTGSGKTESFLYPVLLSLYQEFQQGALGPGVRALVLYPMNALANDQRDRLGEICERLVKENSAFRFTFGQYIGETPENENDSRRHARDHMDRRKPGELVLRSQMRTSPPNILLTNYSMLEYLLLRPDDSPLFDDGRAKWWEFLVLDEAHQYRGSRGIEMGMLLRRLKQRLREGGRTLPFRCIATSATLVGGEGDTAAVAKFATDLFGEHFDGQDVILGDVEPIPDSGPDNLESDDYQQLREIIDGGGNHHDALTRIATKLNILTLRIDELEKAIGHILQHDRRAATLRQMVTGRPAEVIEVADRVFADLPIECRLLALSDLIGLLLRIQDPTSGAPLLSARYHLFVRSLEGAFISFLPSKHIVLDRSTENDSSSVLFEVGLCRECGQHYIVGRINNNKLLEAVRDPSRPDFGATFFLAVDDAKEVSTSEESARTYRLCTKCGEIRAASESLSCGHANSVLLLEQEGSKEREDQVPRCVVCGYQAADPVREVVHGTDGPHSVIATTLYEGLPENRKKVLAFADGRQEAAFFAWYLEHSYKDIVSRNLLLRVAQMQAVLADEGSSMQDLVIGLRDIFVERSVLPPATSQLQIRRQAWIDLYREFLTDEPRISLEGVGLVSWSVKWPPWFRVPDPLLSEPWLLSEQEARNLIFLLLNSMRADRAVEVRGENNVSLNWSDFQLQATQMSFRLGTPGGNSRVRSWDRVDQWGQVRHSKRSALLEKLLGNTAREDSLALAVGALRQIWQSLNESDEQAPRPSDRLFIPINDARRVNPEWWRLRYIEPDASIYICDTCKRIQSLSVRGICPRQYCPGTLRRTNRRELDENHYRLLYESDLPASLRVEEHTAQLDKEKARVFQREFREGKIHILSCSTTFELGVDLGDLDTIFLRNVPPEAFNYAQRVGRAGRRSGQLGFAITYCRRGPHDLYHFAEPNRMLSGTVQPPALSMRNERIVIRHVAALALSYFFRENRERFSTVESLFKDLVCPSGTTDFRAFLISKRSSLEETIARILPDGMADRVGLANGHWINDVGGENSRLSLAESEVSSDYRTVIGLEEKARSERDYRTAEWAKARAKTIAKEEVLSFLSRKAVIPKYGFPVDVVELDTQKTLQSQEAFEVSLQRDLSIAISEFAPTSRLVANKKEWTCYGLKKVAEREWDRRYYARCPSHNVFLQWKKGEPQPTMPCGDRLRPFEYVIPRFGFVTDRDKPKDPKARPPKTFSTRPYFAGSIGPEPQLLPMPANSSLISLKKASPGLMVVLCEGRRGDGFYLCSGCGAAFRARQNSHKTPQGQACRSTLELVSLGHEFQTDVLQLQFTQSLDAVPNAIPFAFSLASALVEGAAEVLEVPSVDLSATVAHADSQAVPPIVIYDNVPGGAGLVARLEKEEVIKRCLTVALKRVDGRCGCDEDKSCYGCLRSYRNQFAHDYLQRGPVKQYLSAVLSSW